VVRLTFQPAPCGYTLRVTSKTSLLQQLGTSSANTACEQTCNNLFADL
jgi:hypothetical protein